MSTNHTENYQLSQWERTDRVQMEDFNADNAKIDAALAAHDGLLAAHAAELAKMGNCQVWTTSYSGSGGVGSGNARSITFPQMPLFAVIINEEGEIMILLPQDSSSVRLGATDARRATLSWSGKTVRWHSTYANDQMNESGMRYYVFAFLN